MCVNFLIVKKQQTASPPHTKLTLGFWAIVWWWPLGNHVINSHNLTQPLPSFKRFIEYKPQRFGSTENTFLRQYVLHKNTQTRMADKILTRAGPAFQKRKKKVFLTIRKATHVQRN